MRARSRTTALVTALAAFAAAVTAAPGAAASQRGGHPGTEPDGRLAHRYVEGQQLGWIDGKPAAAAHYERGLRGLVRRRRNAGRPAGRW